MSCCKNNVDTFEGSISTAKTSLENLDTVSKELIAKKAKIGQHLIDHKLIELKKKRLWPRPLHFVIFIMSQASC